MGFKLLLLREENRPETHIVDGLMPMLEAALPDIEVHLARSAEEAQDPIEEADAAFGNVVPELFARAKKLRWIMGPQAGPDPSFYHPALVESAVTVTNMRGIFDDHISAHILGLLLTFARGLHVYHVQQAARQWRPAAPTVHLPEATALIVGVGGIGAETARLCAEFRMTVLAIDPRVTEPPPGVAELAPHERLDEFAARADFVIVTVPETPATQGRFNAAFFSKMKKEATFINIGRGATVILADLDAALRAGTIAGAALDVFQQEPLPADHPLWDAPGMIVTPHVAAIGPYLDDRRREVFIDNCIRFNEGRPLKNVVDKANWF